jgi:hypothetical protein
MSNFCVKCGGALGPADKFCASCGAQVVKSCPTCGQDWDGKKKEEKAERLAHATKPEQSKAPEKSEKQAESISHQVASQQLTKQTLSTARVQPVYGSLYNPKSDCPNCGRSGQKKNCVDCTAGE